VDLLGDRGVGRLHRRHGGRLRLQALNTRLPQHRRLSSADLQPRGPLVVYLADVRHWYLLVRDGNAEFGNDLDMAVEV
jgi:hypothetical protein